LQYAGNRWRRNRHIDPDQPVPVYIEGRDEVKADSYSGTIAPKGRSPDFYLPADDPRTRESAASCGLFIFSSSDIEYVVKAVEIR